MSDLLYYVELSDPYGEKLAELDQFLRLEYTRAANDVGVLTVNVDAAKVDYALFRKDGRLGVWRQPANGPLALDTDTVWLVRTWRRGIDSQGRRYLQITALSAADLLRRRIVAYAAGSAQAKKSGKADDVMKAFVRENLGSSATDSGRNWSTYLSVEADLGLGPTIAKACSRRNVLTVLQEIAEDCAQQGSPIYFDIVVPEAGGLEFRTYSGQRGQDHRLTSASPVILSPERGNLLPAETVRDASTEITYVYAAGQGQEDAREVATAADSEVIGLSPFGRIEILRDANNVALGDTAGLEAEARAALRDHRARRTFAGSIIDNQHTRYGIHWHWGDYVTAEIDGELTDCRAEKVRVLVQDGQEDIRADLYAEEYL